jgi:hypothetical protein
MVRAFSLTRPSYFQDAKEAESLAKHLMGGRGGTLVRVSANGYTTREIVNGRLPTTPPSMR